MKRAILFYLTSVSLLIFLNSYQVEGQDVVTPLAGIDYQQITADNFKGAPDPADPHAAKSYIGLDLKSEAKLVKRDDGKYETQIVDINYKALFDEKRSWWRGKMEHCDLLKHEQGHFDMAEILARELNANKEQVLKVLRGEGGTPEDSKADHEQKLGDHFLELMKELGEQAERYDTETEHCRNKNKQEEWNKKMGDALKKGDQP
jgi:hypothetical protein